jgi:O-antigen ligase
VAYIACIFYMTLSTGATSVIDRIIYGAWQRLSGDTFTKALNLLAIVVSIVLFLWGAQKPRSPRLNRALPLTAAGLLISSYFWSAAPDTTLTRSMAYLFVVVGAIGIAKILDADEVMRLTALLAGISAALSLLLIFLPRAAVVTGDDFRGLFDHKNVLGQAMAIGVLAGLHGLRIRRRRRLVPITVTLLCMFVAFLSKSDTSLLVIFAFIILHMVGTLYIRGGSRRMISICLTIVIVPIFIVLMMNVDLILTFLEKEPTLTGRTDLWPYLIEYIYQRPWLGWGFTAFWQPSNAAAAEVSAMVGWGFVSTEAHNGLLQLLLDVGILGTALFLYLWLRNLIMAVRCMNGPAPEIGVSALLLLIGILLNGLTEQVLSTPNGWTTQFFLLGFMCEKGLWLARRARSGIDLRSDRRHVVPFEPSQQQSAVKL